MQRRKVRKVFFNSAAESILASASGYYTEQHPAITTLVSFNPDGLRGNVLYS